MSHCTYFFTGFVRPGEKYFIPIALERLVTLKPIGPVNVQSFATTLEIREGIITLGLTHENWQRFSIENNTGGNVTLHCIDKASPVVVNVGYPSQASTALVRQSHENISASSIPFLQLCRQF